MAERTGISWTNSTWNPTVGCSVVSPGCTNCYAMKMAGTRLVDVPIYRGLTKPSKAGPVWTGVVRLNEKALDAPLRWKKPRRIFVNSMSDLFHENLPDEAIDHVFAVMALAPQHTFQVLTKRAKRMREWFAGNEDEGDAFTRVITRAPKMMEDGDRWWSYLNERGWPLPNVWLGISAEDQQRADERIPDLLATPAAVRFVSAEPLLGPIDVRQALSYRRDDLDAADNGGKYLASLGGVDWVIVGGESGPHARPMHPDWARSLRDQCVPAGVPYFFKQWGEWGPAPSAQNYPEAMRFAAGRAVMIHHPPTPGKPYTNMIRYGKRAAGALLDGRAHQEFPE